MNTSRSPTSPSGPAGSRPTVIWLQNTVEHYFSDMIDALNAPQSGPLYHAIFLCDPPAGGGMRLPKAGTFTFIPQSKQWRHSGVGPIEKLGFSAAILGGYDTPFKRKFIRYCKQTGRPLAMFADSNIRSDRGKSLRITAKRFVKRQFLRRLCPSFAAIIPCNRFGEAYWRYYGAKKGQIFRSTYFCNANEINNAVATNGEVIRQRYGLPRSGPFLFTAARLVRVKGLDLMIRAFAEARLAQAGWRWVIAGSGGLRDELQRQATASCGESIRFLGPVPPADVKALAFHSQIFVLPSTFEPHGIVVSEAMAVGTPVIASDICGAAGDLIQQKRTGWTFKSGSVASLTQVIREATLSEAGLQSMRPACQAAFREWYAQYGPDRVIPMVVARMLSRLDQAAPNPRLPSGASPRNNPGPSRKPMSVNQPDRDVVPVQPPPAIEVPFGGNGRVVVVLGAPRTGTSALAHGLECLGVDMGATSSLRPADKENIKGFWEDRRVIDICAKLLASEGLNWNSLRLIDTTDWLSRQHSATLAEAAAVIREGVRRSPGRIWGCKNPQLSRFIGLWTAAIHDCGYEASYVVAIRNPLSFAASVIRGSPHFASGEGPTHLYLTWLVYMLGAIRPVLDGANATLVEYDTLITEPRRQLKRIGSELGLPQTAERSRQVDAFCTDFIDGGLRHATFSGSDLNSDPQVPKIVRKAYGILSSAAATCGPTVNESLKRDLLKLTAEVYEYSATFRLIDQLDSGVLRSRTLARSIYRRAPQAVRRWMARFA